MGIIAWLVFGAVAGVIANLLDSRPAQGGLAGAIVLGIVGAMVGGFIGSLLFGVGVSGFNISSIAVAAAGSLLLLLVGKTLHTA